MLYVYIKPAYFLLTVYFISLKEYCYIVLETNTDIFTLKNVN